MNWKGKLTLLMLAWAIAACIFFRDDPRFVQAWNTVSTHASGIAQQVKHDFQGLQKTLGSVSKLGDAGK